MTDQSEFERQWLQTDENGGGGEGGEPDIKAIREYAYVAFDQLDKNGNGFLEREELMAVLNTPISEREKSFITFLLNNQENIAEMVQEEQSGPSEGISRDDLESYFALISTLLG
ncbi:MAG: hypothetical protein JST01_18560 [Cyanobacteria bacterium SZAS TMP-1]|nr:hypothetical protein [Cyanobacteria bacterium SZAS TMP-1]